MVFNSKVTNNSVHPGPARSPTCARTVGASPTRTGRPRSAAASSTTTRHLGGGVNSSGEGGGIYDSIGVTLTGSTVSNNTAGIQNQVGSAGGAGGGIAEEGGNDLVVLNSHVIGNQALGGLVGDFSGSGGGIMADDISTITNSVIANNHAAQEGGGMWSDDGQHVNAVTFSGNSAQEGGGIWNEWQMSVSNSTISGNSTSGSGNNGGGVFDSGSGGGGYERQSRLVVLDRGQQQGVRRFGAFRRRRP